MTLVPWTPEPEPFGNATGLDFVATDVKQVIAERFGATVTVGRFADDIQVEQAEMRERGRASEPDEPLAIITVSHDGLVISGDWPSGNRHISGYRSSFWLDRMNSETVVFDLRSIPDDQVVRYAVRGPMPNPSLPAGMVSTITIPARMVGVADAYMGSIGATLAETGTPVAVSEVLNHWDLAIDEHNENFPHTAEQNDLLDAVIEAVRRDDGTGICLACGSDQLNIEPDARQRRCETCGKFELYGAEEALARLAP
jgi:hypothetical protein